MNTGKGKKGINCVVCLCVGGRRTGRGTDKPETPSPQQKEACRREGREGGWEEGKMALESSSEKIPGLLPGAETSWHMLLRQVRVG